MKKKELIELKEIWNNMTDQERWETLIRSYNQFKKFIVYLDNDDTFLVLSEPDNDFEEEYALSFDNFIGNKDGIFDLLTVLKINFEEV